MRAVGTADRPAGKLRTTAARCCLPAAGRGMAGKDCTGQGFEAGSSFRTVAAMAAGSW